MPYVVGIDVGTERTAAATCPIDGPEPSGVDVARLGARTTSVPSIVHFGQDGSLLAGDAAAQRSAQEREGTARDFVRRVGDEVPLVVAGRPVTADELTAALVTWTVQRIEGQYASPAEHVVLTHPAEWGPHRKGLLHRALWRAGLGKVTLLPEPIAAGESHALGEPVASGDLLAVYGLGEDTFEAAVIRRADGGAFELLAATEATDHLGGAHFDEAILDLVRAELGRQWAEPDPADPRSRPNMARLRHECTRAKERLSFAADALLPVPVPQGVAQVRVGRADFDELIRPDLDSTVECLLRTLRLGSIEPEKLSAALLTGGSSRIPLVTELLSAALPCPVAVDSDPEFTVARGAALAARRLVTASRRRPAARQPAADQTSVLVPARDDPEGFEGSFGEPPPRPVVEITPLELPRKRSMLRFVPGLGGSGARADHVADIHHREDGR